MVAKKHKNNHKKVTYSIFPPLTDYDKNDEKPQLESSDRGDILKFENELAKKMRIKKLREEEVKNPIIFNYKTEELDDRFTCKISSLPIFTKRASKKGEDDFYKLYIHDSELTSRYSFALTKNAKNINDRTLLISWDDDRWVMQEDFNENLITISIPGQPNSEDKKWFSEAFKFSIGNENTMKIEKFAKDERVNLRNSDTDYEDISSFDKGEKDSLKWDINTENFDLNDSLLVQRLEIQLDSTSSTLNIEVTKKYDTYDDDKKDLKIAKTKFYSSLLLVLIALFVY